MIRILTAATIAASALAVPAFASSPDAWAEFRTETADRCLAAARKTGMKNPEVIVHPLGSEGHGIAVLREGTDKRICLMNKQTKAIEMTPAT